MPRKRNTRQSQNPGSGNISGFWCYIGPTVRGTLQTNTLVIGTLDQMLNRAEKAIQKAPSVRHLIVSGDRLQESRNHIRNNINPEAMLYRRVLRELKEE